MKLTILVTEDYRRRVDAVRREEDLRKCRCWIDLLEGNSTTAEVEFDESGIFLRCGGKTIEDHCGYDAVLALTERRDGILLRLSHKRILFLPITDDQKNNGQVAEAMLLLSGRCQYVFRSAWMRLPGVPLEEKIRYHSRPRQGHFTRWNWTKAAIIMLICCSVFMATVFVTEPLRNRKIQQEEARVKTGTLERIDVSYRKGRIQFVDLEFSDGDKATVDGRCIRQDVEEELLQLPAGTRMRLLIHPGSDRVLQLEAEGMTMLTFADAQNVLWSEAVAFLWLGLLVYAAAAFLTVRMVCGKL